MRKKGSKILDAVHATARGLHAADTIDHGTMRQLEQLCLKPLPLLRPAEIKRIRESANVSQAVFAAMLNTSKSSVQKWEIGQNRPRGTALKLLHLVQKNGLEAVSEHPFRGERALSRGRRFSSSEIHAALFPEARSDAKRSGHVKEGIRRYVRRRRAPGS